MIREQTKTILAILSANYGKNLMPNIDKFAINLWFKFLEDLEFATVQKIIAEWIATHEYPPVVSQIREIAAKEKYGEQRSAEDAWNEALNAAANARYDMMCEEIRKIIDIFGFSRFSRASDFELSQLRNEFIKQWNRYLDEQKKHQTLPPFLLNKKESELLLNKGQEIKAFAEEH